MNSPIIAQRLKILRKEKKLTQLDVSRLVNISNTTLSQYEAGKRAPAFDVLCKLAQIYDSTSDFILGITDIRSGGDGDAKISPNEMDALMALKSNCFELFESMCSLSTLEISDLESLQNLLSNYLKGKKVKK